jgi:hypothetical protein
VADALYGTSTFVDAAAALFEGVPVITQVRSHQQIRVDKREQPVADSCATHPGTPQPRRIRGGDEMGAMVGSARVCVCAHHTTRFMMALTYAGEPTFKGVWYGVANFAVLRVPNTR